MNLFESLGIGWQDILFHLAAIAILVGGLYGILYRPIKKMIRRRKELIASTFAENEKLSAEAKEAKAQYEQSMADARLEVAKISEDAAEKANAKSEEIIKGAQARAQEIIDAAKAEMDAEKLRLSTEYRANITDLSVEIAGAILKKEISPKDNQAIIDDCLNRWAE